jgi:predicted transcriptional regulator
MSASEELIYLRGQIRDARAAAIRDAEAFTEVLFAVERLGSYLYRAVGSLSKYQGKINKLAGNSPLAKEVPAAHPQAHIPFNRLYETVMRARNDALHQGAYARHLTSRVIELTIVLEDALMSSFTTVGEYMVRNPISASLWQPLSFVRQQMLANSFSYLPVLGPGSHWCFVSDLDLARYLRAKAEVRRDRIAETLRDAVASGGLSLSPAKVVSPGETVESVAAKLDHLPIIITLDGQPSGELIGILTAFDLL